MADAPELPRPSQMWKQLSAERKVSAAEAFWKDENAVAFEGRFDFGEDLARRRACQIDATHFGAEGV